MKLRTLIGWAGLRLCNLFPLNDSKINLGQKKIRAFFARKFLSCCGKNVDVQKGASFSHRCQIGERTGIGRNSKLYGPVFIGNDVMMGPECWIYTQNHEYRSLEKPMREQGPQPERPVHIGNNVWIGGRVTILPGVTIGDNTVIGAGSVVNKDIPSNVVAVGNPCRVIKELNAELTEEEKEILRNIEIGQ